MGHPSVLFIADVTGVGCGIQATEYMVYVLHRNQPKKSDSLLCCAFTLSTY